MSNRSEDSHLSNSTASADCRGEEEGERSWPNGQVPEMQELEKEAKPRAEDERKEAAGQEEEDAEVEYNEVGAWELQESHDGVEGLRSFRESDKWM